MSAINCENKPFSSEPGGLPIIRAPISVGGGSWGSISSCACNAKHVPPRLAMKNSRTIFIVFEELKNIENNYGNSNTYFTMPTYNLPKIL
jgi:hypothetical protein